MQFKITVTVALTFFLVSAGLIGQSWTTYMEVETTEEFREIQKEFAEYWSGREIEKGSGYKPFKRWEQRWEQRIVANGQIPQSGKHLKAFDKFLKSYTPEISTRDANSPWESLGPNSTTGGYAGTGRIMSIGFHPTDNSTVYVGSAGGGLWKTTDGGQSWLPKTDFLGSLGISGIIVDNSNPEIIYIGTGDGDAANNYSIGVLKSTDGGDSWNNTGLQWSTNSTRLIRNMVVHPSDSNMILVASNDGIYRTANGGITWSQVVTGNFYDIELNPSSSSNTFYASRSNSIYRSTNNGVTWSLAYTVPSSNRISLATSTANSDYLYALSSGTSSGANGSSGYNGIYRSTDQGSTFSLMSNSPNILSYSADGSSNGGQGWYDLVISVDPTDEEIVHVGGINHWKSNDGGTNWTLKSHWIGDNGVPEVHADKHLLEFSYDNFLWEGNDGGIYKTEDSGDTWIDLTSDMVISQMYRVAVSEDNSRLLSGLQDNGTKRRNTDSIWNDVLGGDGMDCEISPIDNSVMYGESQYGKINRSINGGQNWTYIANGLPSGAWITPIAINNVNVNQVYIGFDQIYKSDNQGTTWYTISDVFDGNNMTFLEVSEIDQNYIYTGYNNQLWSSSDGGDSWVKRSTPALLSMVRISKSNPKTIYGTVASYESGNKVFKSTDSGKTWYNISDNLPNIPANCIAIHNDGEETLYVGMDVGVYFRTESSSQWTLMNTDLPNAEIRELEIKKSANEIFSATYGRGMWKNSAIGITSSCLAPKNLTITVNDESSGQATWETPSIIPENGYEYAFNESFTPPTSGTNITNLSVDLSGMEAETDYFFHIRSMCDSDQSSWITYGPVKGKILCGGVSYDSGGSTSNYSNNEYTVINICPLPGETDLTIDFTSFSTETGYDALYIHNGPDVSSPLFPGGATSMQNNFPIGGFTGFGSPGSFTSTDQSGCITLEFRSDGSSTRFGWVANVSCTESDICSVPINASVQDISSTTATIQWQAPIDEPSNGYEYAVSLNSSPPTNGISTNSLSAEIIDLLPESTYYLHIRSLCANLNSDWITTSFITKYGCTSVIYDSGGENENYSNNEDLVYSICPNDSTSKVTITFDTMGIEVNYDALYIHDGPDINSSLFPGGVTSMLNDFPIGGFYGNTAPDPFTSTDSSGCITLRILSDFSVTELGWKINVSCTEDCSSVVSNSNDTGLGSMRDAIECVEDGGTIEIDPSMYNQMISISSPLVIDKEIYITQTTSSTFSIQTTQMGPVYKITPSGNLTLDNVEIYGGTSTTASAIDNSGTLKLENVVIKKNPTVVNQSSLVLNLGLLTISGDTEIQE